MRPELGASLWGGGCDLGDTEGGLNLSEDELYKASVREREPEAGSQGSCILCSLGSASSLMLKDGQGCWPGQQTRVLRALLWVLPAWHPVQQEGRAHRLYPALLGLVPSVLHYPHRCVGNKGEPLWRHDPWPPLGQSSGTPVTAQPPPSQWTHGPGFACSHGAARAAPSSRCRGWGGGWLCPQ